MSLFSNGGYSQAVFLVWFQMLLTAVTLAAVVYRYTSRADLALVAFTVFLAGNSAVFTGVWVRQYALFVLCYVGLVAISGELVRTRLTSFKLGILATSLGLISLFGMMTQYTFITMSGPIHLALLTLLMVRKQWSRLGILMVAYAAAGALFFYLLPGAVEHASAVSRGMERKWQLLDALRGVPRMYIPMPSTLPTSVLAMAGIAALLAPLVIAITAVRQASRNSGTDDKADVRIPLAGMLGAGVLQVMMVTLGFYPGWATGENHMCAFWLLTVLASSVLIAEWSAKARNVVVAVVLVGMLGMQGLFIWYTHSILPRVNTSYIASQQPDLVCIDNLARGFVLQVTDVIPPDRLVLATESHMLAERLQGGSLPDRILYLPMDTTVHTGKPAVLAAAEQGGYLVKELSVVHTGMYEALLLTRNAD